MRAALYYGLEDIRIEDVENPDPGPGEVKVRVAYNGLCGSDVHEYFDGPRSVPLEPHPLTGAHAPLILGHEIAGHVVGVGAGVTDIDEGALVAIEPIVTCGECRYCTSGAYNMCDKLAFHGLSTGGGGLAEFTVVNRAMAHPVPANVSPAHAALVEPLAVAAHGVARAGLRPGSVAVVLGGGPIGIGLYLTLRSKQVEAIVIEPVASRRAVLEGLGARTLDPTEGDVADAVWDLTGGVGADGAFDVAAAPLSFAAAVDCTARRGTVVVMASPRAPAASNVLTRLLAREIDVRTSFAYCGDFTSVIEAVALGVYPLEGWVSTAGLSSVPEVLRQLRDGELLKVLIDPSAP